MSIRAFIFRHCSIDKNSCEMSQPAADNSDNGVWVGVLNQQLLTVGSSNQGDLAGALHWADGTVYSNPPPINEVQLDTADFCLNYWPTYGWDRLHDNDCSWSLVVVCQFDCDKGT